MGIADKLAEKATAAAEAGRRMAVEKAADAGPRLREILAMEADRPLTPEKLVLLLVGAVRDDGEPVTDIKQVEEVAKRNERVAAAAGLLPGPAGFLAELYCDADLVCAVADFFQLALSDDDVAAHLLVMWQAMPDFGRAQRAISLDDAQVSVVAEATQRLKTHVSAMNKRQVLQLISQLRNISSDLVPGGGVGDLIFTKRAFNQRLNEVVEELGIDPHRLKSGGLFHRFGAMFHGDDGDDSRTAIDPAQETKAALMSTAAESPVQAAGWYSDPTGGFEYRYWDGERWTQHVSTGGTQSVNPL